MIFDLLKYWDSTSSYFSFIENIEDMNTKDLHPMIPNIKSPALVVGVGQRLLVEELRKKGFGAEGVDFGPQTVTYAQKRRGIILYCANANDMPFEDRI